MANLTGAASAWRVTDIAAPVAEESRCQVVDALDDVAAETGKTVRQVALNWLLQRPGVTSLIIGARNHEQFRQDLGAVGWNLTPAPVERLDAAGATTPPLPRLAPAGLRGAESLAGRLRTGLKPGFETSTGRARIDPPRRGVGASADEKSGLIANSSPNRAREPNHEGFHQLLPRDFFERARTGAPRSAPTEAGGRPPRRPEGGQRWSISCSGPSWSR
jgi:hypothetical protein